MNHEPASLGDEHLAEIRDIRRQIDVEIRRLVERGMGAGVFDTPNPAWRHARTTDEGGRGLFLVAQLTRRQGTRYTLGFVANGDLGVGSTRLLRPRRG